MGEPAYEDAAVRPRRDTPVSNRGVLRGVILDTQPLWQDALSLILERFGFGVVDICASLEEFDATVRDTRPHVLLVDPYELSGVAERLRTLQNELPHLFVIAVSSQSAGLSALRFPAGAPFVPKGSELHDIDEALRGLIEERLDWAGITPRQVEILRLVADGASNRSIASLLWLSQDTVKFHLANAYRALGVLGRREAVLRARELGLLASPQLDIEV